MRFAHLGTLVLTLAVGQVAAAQSIQELAANLAAADQEMR